MDYGRMGRPPIGDRPMTAAERSARRWRLNEERIQNMRGALVEAAAVLMRAGKNLAQCENNGLARECGLMAERALNVANDDPAAVIKLAIPGGEQGKYERERAERRSLIHYISDTKKE